MARVIPQVARKLGGLLLTLLLSSIAIFSAVQLTPGDPVAALAGGAKPTPELIAELTAQYHLDDPLWMQYLRWAGGFVTGDLGRSYVYNADVATLIGPRLEVTTVMVVYSTLLMLVFGVGSGVFAALRPRWDRAVLLMTSLGVALPTFVISIVLVWVFALGLGWFPVYGTGDGSFGDLIYHLTLPSIALALLFIAYLGRVTRAALVRQRGSEHVDTATVRGVPPSRIFRSHVLYNASPQILSVLGLSIAGLFAASAVAEQAFGISGFGSLLAEAASRKDLPMVQALSMLLVTIFVVVNAITDIAIAVIDPDSLKSVRAS